MNQTKLFNQEWFFILFAGMQWLVFSSFPMFVNFETKTYLAFIQSVLIALEVYICLILQRYLEISAFKHGFGALP